jgi:GTP cyclohydrolase I|tara:strand:- start:48 stop:623 length:576 start_codon:yes stop_codon:yes gene_type:complete
VNTKNISNIKEITSALLDEIGEDTNREGLLETPSRVAKAWEYFSQGYRLTPKEVVGDAIFNEKCNDIIAVKDIDFFSLCEHHLLPFYGVVHVGYLPGDKIMGISKIPRIVDVFARRLQVQERMTKQVADAIEDILQPKGVAVMAEASHLCMQMRGVEKKASFMVTSAMRGAFKENHKTRDEFLTIISQDKR